MSENITPAYGQSPAHGPQIKRVKLADLTPDPQNANLGTERGLALLDDSLRTLGAGRSILVDKNGKIIAGNKTHERALDIGLTDVLLVPTDGTTLVAVVRTDLDLESDPRAKRLALADNRIGEIDLAWAPEVLLDLANQYGHEITAGLWSESEWRDSIVAQAAKEAAAPEDQTESDQLNELAQKWGTQPGQLWLIPSATVPGSMHRLYCGDATRPADINKTMGDRLANLLVTSPPYWVGMSYETQKSESEIDSFIKACVLAWTDSVNVNCGRIIINTGTAAIHHIDKTRRTEVLILVDKWQNALRQRGWIMRHIRVWAKGAGGLQGVTGTLAPHTDAISQGWENLIEFAHHDTDSEFSYLGTFWNPAGDQRGQERADISWAQQGVWSDIPGDASAGGKHVAAFPVEIPRRFILLYSKPGEIVFDPFIGSGTTLLAAEFTHRLVCGLEYSPQYLAGALERFEENGLTPQLAGLK